MFLLVACATVPQHSMQVDQVQGFKLVSVVFKGAENISSWPSEEANYLKQASIDSMAADKLRAGAAQYVPEVHSFFAKKLEERFEPSFRSAVGSAINGTRPVKAVVTIRKFNVPSTAVKVLVNNTSSVSATIVLVDAKTDAPLLTYEGVVEVKQGIGGVAALVTSVLDVDQRSEDSLMSEYFLRYKKWLLKE